ncbi:hypothetical protein A2U01_0056870, partial [Trifolium medium]|nr:hypothetical protein [Trifolium medium]
MAPNRNFATIPKSKALSVKKRLIFAQRTVVHPTPVSTEEGLRRCPRPDPQEVYDVYDSAPLVGPYTLPSGGDVVINMPETLGQTTAVATTTQTHRAVSLLLAAVIG